ncbi:hypothetical protein [Pseudalkalibacillus decolorationis]|uniref:hypothetical protein n=1 Tax=Pseudalkalibacillus decolorationis TaxID=163879 RepID=UPI0021483FDF|nr:hypothetical protein [Pseudalkalibacillus decolorationis]
MNITTIGLAGRSMPIVYIDYIEVIRISLAAFLGTQFATALPLLVLGRVQYEYYTWGIYEKPCTKPQKIQNIIMFSMVGSGCYIYKRLLKYNWFVRKFLYLILVLLQGILSIIIFTIIDSILKGIS